MIDLREKKYVVTGMHVSKYKYHLISEEFGIDGIYEGALKDIEAKLKEEMKSKLIFNISAEWLVSAPYKKSNKERFEHPDVIIIVSIPLEEIDSERIWENAGKIK